MMLQTDFMPVLAQFSRIQNDLKTVERHILLVDREIGESVTQTVPGHEGVSAPSCGPSLLFPRYCQFRWDSGGIQCRSIDLCRQTT